MIKQFYNLNSTVALQNTSMHAFRLKFKIIFFHVIANSIKFVTPYTKKTTKQKHRTEQNRTENLFSLMHIQHIDINQYINTFVTTMT
jgi:hypothetical protein